MKSVGATKEANGEFGGIDEDGGWWLFLLFVNLSLSLAFVFNFEVSINRKTSSKLDLSKTDAGVMMEDGPAVKERGMVVPGTVGRIGTGAVAKAGTTTVVEGVLLPKQNLSSSSLLLSSSLSS
jgi:hypothetical protein